MRNHFRTSLLILVSIMMTAALVLTACGTNTGSPNDSSGEESPSSGNSNSGGGSGERITLTVELFDRNNTPAGEPPITDNFMTKYIQENFGDPNNIDVQFVTVPRAEEVQKLNVLMASNSAPDIIFTYDKPTVQNYVQSGGLTDLGPLIEEHGPQLKKVLEPGATLRRIRWKAICHSGPARHSGANDDVHPQGLAGRVRLAAA